MSSTEPRTKEGLPTEKTQKKRIKAVRPASRHPEASPVRIVMGAVVATMCVITALHILLPVPEKALAASVRRARSVVYVPDRHDLQLARLHPGQIDQLNYAFALIEDGEASGEHWQSIQKVSAYLRKHPQVDGVLAVGGWGADGFSQACATEEGRRKLADSLLALMDEHGFIGLDVDWEYPGSSAAGIASSEHDVENWYALLALLREGLNVRTQATGRKHLLSVAVGAGEALLKDIDGARLNELVDQVVVMAYDLAGFDRQTGHHAGLYPDVHQRNTGAYAVNALIAEGLAADKLLLGIPAYGRVWREVSGGGDGLHQRAATTGNRILSFDALQALTDTGYIRHYDPEAQASWWFDGSCFASGEDAQSIARKADWIVERGLLGTALWSFQHDPSGSMLAMLHEALLP